MKKNKLRRMDLTRLLAIKCLLLIVGILHLLLIRNGQSPEIIVNQRPINFVLVNEDLGANFNDEDYHFGADFVTLVNQDTQNRWHTTSRSVAEAGLNSGNFDALVILPQNFSVNLLSLESVSPEQALIIYEVRLGGDELTNLMITAQVSSVLADFERRIVQMYFSSILDNLLTAQVNVGAMVNDEARRHESFLTGVRDPFNSVPSFLNENIDEIQLLALESEIWRTLRFNFNDWVDQLLSDVGARLDAQKNQIHSYAEFMKQLSVANKHNAEFVLFKQSEQDAEFYYDQFLDLYKTVLSELALFYDSDGGGILSFFYDEALEFYELQTELQQLIDAEIEITDEMQVLLMDMEQEVGELLQLRALVGEIFFADANASVNEVSREDVKRALFNFLQIVEEDECEYEYECEHEVEDEDKYDDEREDDYQNEDEDDNFDKYVYDERDNQCKYDDEAECDVEDEEKEEVDIFLLVIEKMVDLFWARGIELYGELTQQYYLLSEMIEVKTGKLEASQLSELPELVTEPERFLTKVKDFAHWYQGAVTTAVTSYESFETAAVLALEMAHHRGEFNLDAPSMRFYFDESYKRTIIQNMHSLTNNFTHDLALINAQDNEIGDLTNSFTNIVETTFAAHDLSANLVTNMDAFSNQIDSQVTINSKFAVNFSQVLANTRIPGGENPAVLRFLARPLVLIGRYTQREIITEEPHFWRVGTISLLGIGGVISSSKVLFSAKDGGVKNAE